MYLCGERASFIAAAENGSKISVTDTGKCAVHNLLQEGNDNSIIKELTLGHQTRLSIFRRILVVIKMWNLYPKQTKEKVMTKYCMKMECGIKNARLPLITVQKSGLSSFMTMMTQLKYPFLTKKSDCVIN